MPSYRDTLELIQNEFSGIVPILELDNCVLLPGSLISLRISKTADCQSIEDALAEKALIAVSLKLPGINPQTEIQNDFEINFVCLASIVSYYQLDSGEYSVLLRGVCRARYQRLFVSDHPRQKVLLDLKPDFYSDKPVIHREHRQLELLELYSKIYSEYFSDPVYYHVLHQELALGELCDILANTIKLEPALCQLILEEHDVDLRSDLLLSFLKKKLRELKNNPFARSMSMEFSRN